VARCALIPWTGRSGTGVVYMLVGPGGTFFFSSFLCFFFFFFAFIVDLVSARPSFAYRGLGLVHVCGADALILVLRDGLENIIQNKTDFFAIPLDRLRGFDFCLGEFFTNSAGPRPSRICACQACSCRDITGPSRPYGFSLWISLAGGRAPRGGDLGWDILPPPRIPRVHVGSALRRIFFRGILGFFFFFG